MQDEIFTFLSDPKNYSAGVIEVIRIDTHGAVIFLAGKFAYKIKRAVKLGYLDYSTLEKREKMCRLEFEINRITAPEIYMDVVPITRTSEGGFMFGGDAHQIEWTLKMHRFSQENLLSHIALSDSLTDKQITQLAEMIVSYHHAAPPADISNSQNRGEKLNRILASLKSSFEGAREVLNGDLADDYLEKLKGAIDQHKGLVLERGRHGFIRRCHGDMHLQNIVLLNGQPRLFDAIEFDDDIATIDILYDLAFLIMDLRFHGLSDHANFLFNEYLRCFDDEQNLKALAIMPMFLSMRAAIRAMVSIDQMFHISGEEKSAIIEKIREYLALADDALEINHPSLILIGGLSGTGKSTMGRAISSSVPPLPGAVHLRSDVERKTMFKVAPQVKLPEENYSEYYSDKVYKNLRRKAANILDAGHSVIVDAVFLSNAHRAMFEELADGRDIDLKTIWLEAPNNTLLTRVEARRNDASDARSAVVKSQFNAKSAPSHWITIDAGSEPQTVVDRICAALNISVHRSRGKQSE